MVIHPKQHVHKVDIKFQSHNVTENRYVKLTMKKLFAIDLKRLLNNKAAVIAAIAAPLLLVLLISIAVAPYFFSDVRAKNFSVAVFCEDEHPYTTVIINSLIESKSLSGLISTQMVGSEQEGMDAVKEGAAAYIHIPENMMNSLGSGGIEKITYYSNPDMPLEDALLFETLSSGVELVSHGQHAINVLYTDTYNAGIDTNTVPGNELMTTLQLRILGRAELYEDTGETSPLGGALPVQYYAVSFLILFIALGGMPIARLTADDYATGLINRQLFSGNTPAVCFASRWLAGGTLIFIEYAVLWAALCAITGGFAPFSGNILTMFIFGVLLSALVSMGMLLAGLFSKTSSFAVRLSFMSALALSLAGGLIIPSAYMPTLIRDFSYYTPFAAALRMGISGMYDGSAGGVLLSAGILAAFIAVMLPLSVRSFQRRSR